MEPELPQPPPRTDSAPRWEPRRFRFVEHPLFHLGLLAATFVTTTIAGGAFSSSGGLMGKGRFADGLPFSVPLLVILGTHELGHYFMCRRYGLAATLPYFIPSPFLNLIGTFGALIRIKEPLRDKRVMIDVGAAGPLAGFAMSLPFLFYGVTRATPVSGPSPEGTVLFEYPMAVRIAQQLTGAGAYTSTGVHEHPVFMAAWFGLLVTALNLLPVGQLDGGHVLRAAAGRRQPAFSLAVLALAALSAFRGLTWAVFALVTSLLVGIRHPPADNDDEPLDYGRTMLALLCLGVFLLCFSLVPIRIT
ncbi:MAG TPA: site-2 protease family protein [Thermoanaerobaculia bacterium]|nr:site-2 protease family protein [Thermoanaerobaculia bacterium]